MIVPGIILVVGLVLAVPALVIERAQRERRALALLGADAGVTLAHVRLAAYLLILLYVPIAAIGGVVAMFVPGAGRSSPARRSSASPPSRSSGLVQIFIYPLFYCVLTVAYYDLRVRKEGFDLEVLASTLRTA